MARLHCLTPNINSLDSYSSPCIVHKVMYFVHVFAYKPNAISELKIEKLLPKGLQSSGGKIWEELETFRGYTSGSYGDHHPLTLDEELLGWILLFREGSTTVVGCWLTDGATTAILNVSN